MVDYHKATRVGMAKKGMKQYQLAKALGITPNTLCRCMKGNQLKTERLEQIAKILDLKVSELVALGEE